MVPTRKLCLVAAALLAVECLAASERKLPLPEQMQAAFGPIRPVEFIPTPTPTSPTTTAVPTSSKALTFPIIPAPDSPARFSNTTSVASTTSTSNVVSQGDVYHFDNSSNTAVLSAIDDLRKEIEHLTETTETFATSTTSLERVSSAYVHDHMSYATSTESEPSATDAPYAHSDPVYVSSSTSSTPAPLVNTMITSWVVQDPNPPVTTVNGVVMKLSIGVSMIDGVSFLYTVTPTSPETLPLSTSSTSTSTSAAESTESYAHTTSAPTLATGDSEVSELNYGRASGLFFDFMSKMGMLPTSMSAPTSTPAVMAERDNTGEELARALSSLGVQHVSAPQPGESFESFLCRAAPENCRKAPEDCSQGRDCSGAPSDANMSSEHKLAAREWSSPMTARDTYRAFGESAHRSRDKTLITRMVEESSSVSNAGNDDDPAPRLHYSIPPEHKGPGGRIMKSAVPLPRAIPAQASRDFAAWASANPSVTMHQGPSGVASHFHHIGVVDEHSDKQTTLLTKVSPAYKISERMLVIPTATDMLEALASANAALSQASATTSTASEPQKTIWFGKDDAPYWNAHHPCKVPQCAKPEYDPRRLNTTCDRSRYDYKDCVLKEHNAVLQRSYKHVEPRYIVTTTRATLTRTFDSDPERTTYRRLVAPPSSTITNFIEGTTFVIVHEKRDVMTGSAPGSPPDTVGHAESTGFATVVRYEKVPLLNSSARSTAAASTATTSPARNSTKDAHDQIEYAKYKSTTLLASPDTATSQSLGAPTFVTGYETSASPKDASGSIDRRWEKPEMRDCLYDVEKCIIIGGRMIPADACNDIPEDDGARHPCLRDALAKLQAEVDKDPDDCEHHPFRRPCVPKLRLGFTDTVLFSGCGKALSDDAFEVCAKDTFCGRHPYKKECVPSTGLGAASDSCDRSLPKKEFARCMKKASNKLLPDRKKSEMVARDDYDEDHTTEENSNKSSVKRSRPNDCQTRPFSAPCTGGCEDRPFSRPCAHDLHFDTWETFEYQSCERKHSDREYEMCVEKKYCEGHPWKKICVPLDKSESGGCDRSLSEKAFEKCMKRAAKEAPYKGENWFWRRSAMEVRVDDEGYVIVTPGKASVEQTPKMVPRDDGHVHADDENEDKKEGLKEKKKKEEEKGQ